MSQFLLFYNGQLSFEQNIQEIAHLASKLQEKGIELKDMQMGLIDFPAQRFEQPVYLCWKLGESKVKFWHNIHSGYNGRRLLQPEALAR